MSPTDVRRRVGLVLLAVIRPWRWRIMGRTATRSRLADPQAEAAAAWIAAEAKHHLARLRDRAADAS